MPLLLQRGRIPLRWAERKHFRPSVPIEAYGRPTDCVNIALVNNMPDAAVEDTEMQFFELLETAADDIPVFVKLYSLPGISRGERARHHLSECYEEFAGLWSTPLDAIIVTGTEPHCPNLRKEPFWPMLTELLDWADRHTISAVFSCLAAHASVLHGDGIERHRLDDKRFGIFEFAKTPHELLTGHSTDHIQFPHSRWNEVREHDLRECGYVVLTKSAEAGVDCFVKRKIHSLFLHFQGHPEYQARTLLKEYKRDIKRFLSGERDTYPSLPRGYFDAEATMLLEVYKESAIANRHEELIIAFPESALVARLHNGWNSSASLIYRNWLDYVRARKVRSYRAVGSYGETQEKRSAVL